MQDLIDFLKSDTPQLCVNGGEGTCAPLGGSIVILIALAFIFLMYKAIFKKR